MARRSVVVALYQPCADETFQVRVEAASCYPDAVDEARVQAVRGVRELIDAALAAYPADARPEVAEAGDE